MCKCGTDHQCCVFCLAHGVPCHVGALINDWKYCSAMNRKDTKGVNFLRLDLIVVDSFFQGLHSAERERAGGTRSTAEQ